MLAYVSIVIALCSITVCLIFVLTWAYLGHEIRHSSLLQEEFQTTVRRLIGDIGLFAIPVSVYLLDGKQSANNAEPFAFAWGACYVVSLLMLAAGLITLIRDGSRERKTGLYRAERRELEDFLGVGGPLPSLFNTRTYTKTPQSADQGVQVLGRCCFFR